MMKFQVIKTDGETGRETKVGAAVKTVRSANSLRQRMRASRQLGSSDSFRVVEVAKGAEPRLRASWLGQ